MRVRGDSEVNATHAGRAADLGRLDLRMALSDESHTSMAPRNEIPDLPRLVLRVAFAGSRQLPVDDATLRMQLRAIFETIAQRLAQIAPGTPITTELPEAQVRDFYANDPPLLRLVTGLCEGADALAADMLRHIDEHPELHEHVVTELAAVVPFDLPSYRSSREDDFIPEFDQQAARCSYILALDGIHEDEPQDTVLAKNRRARAYHAQSEMLLRHADLLIALADADESGRAGGTMETVRAALRFDRPVIFIDRQTGSISLIEPRDNVHEALSRLTISTEAWQRLLRQWITTILADPDADCLPDGSEDGLSHGQKILREFFHEQAMPPLKLDGQGRPVRTPGHGERLWTRFESWFRAGDMSLASDEGPAPFGHWRSRSSGLNYHYSGLYRGTFVGNYMLAFLAVMLAALSLVLIGIGNAQLSAGALDIGAGELAHGTSKSLAAAHATPPWWLFPSLLILGASKLASVWLIWRNTHRANKSDWNDKAVDYRYLSERLRAMVYLPSVGSFQPPAAAPPQYASRVVRQSAVDWLFGALVRSVSPADPKLGLARRVPADARIPYPTMQIHLSPIKALENVQDRWLQGQANYHAATARRMARMHEWAEGWGRILNLGVIFLVGADIASVLAELSHALPNRLATILPMVTPWLVFLAAVLPAAVASLNGIRFQTECRRLADRSAVIRTIIEGHRKPATVPQRTLRRRIRAQFEVLFPRAARAAAPTPLNPHNSQLAIVASKLNRIREQTANPKTDPGSWTPEALRFTESVASIFVQEVAEWTVLYAKEVPEP